MENRYNIRIAGMGYVGLSLAVLLSRNNSVTITDILEEKVELLNHGICPVEDILIRQYLLEGKAPFLRAAADTPDSYADADFVIIATPTNYDPQTDCFDTAAVEHVVDEVLSVNKEAVIIIRSTVPVGYTGRLRKKTGATILFSPEFLRESKALYDNLYPSRIIAGFEEGDLDAAKRFAGLLCREALNEPEVLFMSASEAEAVKLFSNTYLALRVSFFNELDTYAEVKGLRADNIIRGVSLDPRIGNHYNNPSFGYGGYCLPKDTKQLLANYRDVPENLIRAIVDSNGTRKKFIASRVMRLALERTRRVEVSGNGECPYDSGHFRKDEHTHNDGCPVIGVFRLAMKTDSDNFRESSIVDVMRYLQEMGAEVIVYEPALEEKKYQGCPVVNEWREFADRSTLIIANRFSDELREVSDKVYTRDIFCRD